MIVALLTMVLVLVWTYVEANSTQGLRALTSLPLLTMTLQLTMIFKILMATLTLLVMGKMIFINRAIMEIVPGLGT